MDIVKEEKNLREVLKAITDRAAKKELISEASYDLRKIKEEIAGLLEVDIKKIKLEIPPDHVGGDLAFGTFEVAKDWQVKPLEAAETIAGKINGGSGLYLDKAIVAGPFVNIFLKRPGIYAAVLNSVSMLRERYGETDHNKGKKAWIEYSSPNMAKPLGVNHIGTTFIGEALSRIYEKTGYAVIRHNYIGDWGTPFGKLLFAYRKWHSGDEPSIQVLKDLYVRFNKEVEEDPTIAAEARSIAKSLEAGDEEVVSLWQRFRDLSIQYFLRMYEKIGIKFDTLLGESFFTDKMAEVIKDAQASGVTKKDSETGALVVDLGGGIPTFLLQKGDGTSLYHTRDLAALKFRVSVSNADTFLYVIGPEQTLYLKQLFELSRRLNYSGSAELKHIAYGLLLMGGEKMATRKGTTVELEALIEQAAAKAGDIIEEKNPELDSEEKQKVAETVGLGAVIYNQLRQSRSKNINFDWDRMLDFESGSAAYLQYTHARIKSILRKVGEPKDGQFVFEKEVEFKLARKLLFFPSIILEAQKLDSPHLIATYLEELAQLLNTFYGEISIMATDDSGLKNSRLCLISSVAQVIKNGLTLLNIGVPERM